jgi:hypothetical protein
VILQARSFGVDELRIVEHFGRYTTKVPVPRRFVWEQHRERGLECPMVQWRIGDRWFAVVIPAEPDQQGWLDYGKAETALRAMIASTLSRPQHSTNKGG